MRGGHVSRSEKKESSQVSGSTTPGRTQPGPYPKRGMDRRKFLGLVGAAGASVLAVATADRFFLRNSSATATGGKWSEPQTWGGHVPGPKDTAVISGKVTLDTNPTVAGIVIEPSGALTFDPAATRTLKSSGNVVVQGKLTMKPASSTVVHTLRFIGVDEQRFRGGDTETPLATDVGLWVMDGGMLQLEGTPKTAWTRQPTTATGWRNADEIAVSPVKKGDFGFAMHTGGSVPSKLPTWDAYTAEALNLTRNVVVQGDDASHRAHVFVRNTSPVVHTVSNVLFRYLGPRGGERRTRTGGTLGRYPLHFHMNMGENAGTIVDGCVVRDCGNRGFWPHMTDHITFRNCIVYNSTDEAYGWDLGDDSNSVTFDNCVAAHVLAGDPSRGYRLTGFLLGAGTGNTCTGCVATGVQGTVNAAGFEWPERPDASHKVGVWTFNDCISHNNVVNGIFTWQNDHVDIHSIRSFNAYHNGQSGIEHGAYSNAYQYVGMSLKENGNYQLLDHAVSNSHPGPLLFQSVIMDGKGSTPYALKFFDHLATPRMPMRFLDCTLTGHVTNAVLVDQSNGRPATYDFIHTKVGSKERDLTEADFTLRSLRPGSIIRVQNQNDSSAFQITSSGVSKIAPFWTA